MSNREKPAWRENNEKRNRESNQTDSYSHKVCSVCGHNKMKVNGVLMCTVCD